MTTPTNKPTDRRASRRVKPNGQVRIECRRGTLGLGKDVACRLLDVSESGARLIVREVFLTKAEVELVFLGFGGKLRQESVVYRCDPLEDGTVRIGVRFRNRLNYRQLQALS